MTVCGQGTEDDTVNIDYLPHIYIPVLFLLQGIKEM